MSSFGFPEIARLVWDDRPEVMRQSAAAFLQELEKLLGLSSGGAHPDDAPPVGDPSGEARAERARAAGAVEELARAGESVLAQIEALEVAKAGLEADLLAAYAALHTIESQQLEALPAGSGSRSGSVGGRVATGRIVAEEISLATGVGAGEVARRLTLATAPRRHARILSALREGTTSLHRALQVTSETAELCDADVALVEEAVLAPSRDGRVCSQRAFVTRLRRAVASVDGRGADERRARARARRGVFGRLTGDGMACLTLVTGADAFAAIMDRLDGLARSARSGGDLRTLDQLRCDVATEALLHSHHEAGDPATPATPSPRSGTGTRAGTDTGSGAPTSHPFSASAHASDGADARESASDGTRVRESDGADAASGGTRVPESGGADAASDGRGTSESDGTKARESVSDGTGAPMSSGAGSGAVEDTGTSAMMSTHATEADSADSAESARTGSGRAMGGSPDRDGGPDRSASGPPLAPDPPYTSDPPAPPDPRDPADQFRPTTARAAGHPGAMVWIVVPFEVVAGSSDAACELPGHGWVTAAHAREIITRPGSVWRTLPVDVSSGRALSRPGPGYRPTAAMVEHVEALDGTCRAPGCEIPAVRCDLDHEVPWPAGPTTVDNLHAKHRFHHNLKTDGVWTSRPIGDRGLEWTTLTGRSYTTRPKDWRVGVDRQRAADAAPDDLPRSDPPPF